MLQISTQDKETLEAWLRAATTEQRLVTRARIILALAQGCTNRQVARRLELRAATVSKWRGRFAKEGPAGLADESRSGKPPTSSSTRLSWSPPGTGASSRASAVRRPFCAP